VDCGDHVIGVDVVGLGVCAKPVRLIRAGWTPPEQASVVQIDKQGGCRTVEHRECHFFSMGKLLRCVSQEPSGPSVGSSSERAGQVTGTRRVLPSTRRRASKQAWPNRFMPKFLTELLRFPV